MREVRALHGEATMAWPTPWSVQPNLHEDYWLNTFDVVDARGDHLATCEYVQHAELLVAVANGGGAA